MQARKSDANRDQGRPGVGKDADAAWWATVMRGLCPMRMAGAGRQGLYRDTAHVDPIPGSPYCEPRLRTNPALPESLSGASA